MSSLYSEPFPLPDGSWCLRFLPPSSGSRDGVDGSREDPGGLRVSGDQGTWTTLEPGGPVRLTTPSFPTPLRSPYPTDTLTSRLTSPSLVIPTPVKVRTPQTVSVGLRPEPVSSFDGVQTVPGEVVSDESFLRIVWGFRIQERRSLSPVSSLVPPPLRRPEDRPEDRRHEG